ncbi:hypothetical protein TIFTF001_023140 [Ficus carica]|uniref:Uncharacterized protein n=1 Tax=Ficus carica TaxID=3494 RepID=A0AA88AN12_FICCA|nr:hypothetical protein TIFTF001_023140 [Ficus carica]
MAVFPIDRGCPVDGSHVWDRGCNLVTQDQRSWVGLWVAGARTGLRRGGVGEMPEYSCVGKAA